METRLEVETIVIGLPTDKDWGGMLPFIADMRDGSSLHSQIPQLATEATRTSFDDWFLESHVNSKYYHRIRPHERVADMLTALLTASDDELVSCEFLISHTGLFPEGCSAGQRREKLRLFWFDLFGDTPLPDDVVLPHAYRRASLSHFKVILDELWDSDDPDNDPAYVEGDYSGPQDFTGYLADRRLVRADFALMSDFVHGYPINGLRYLDDLLCARPALSELPDDVDDATLRAVLWPFKTHFPVIR